MISQYAHPRSRALAHAPAPMKTVTLQVVQSMGAGQWPQTPEPGGNEVYDRRMREWGTQISNVSPRRRIPRIADFGT